MRAFLKSPLFIALAIAVACIFSGDDRNVEHPYWNIVFKLISEPAPDTAMIVSLDEGQGGSAGLAVNSSALQAQVVDRLLADGAQRIFLDFPYSRAGDPDGDAALKRVLGDAGSRVVLVNRATYEKPQPHLDVPQFQPSPENPVVASAWNVNFMKYAVATPSNVVAGGRRYPSAALAASGMGALDGWIMPDYRLDPSTIRTVGADQILRDQVGRDRIAGRTIYLTSTSKVAPTTISYFGHAKIPSAAADIAAANGLKRRTNTVVPGYPLLLAFGLLILAGRSLRRTRTKVFFYAASTAILLGAPGLLLDHGIYTSIGTTLIALPIYGAGRAWQKWRARVQQTNSASGLPNIEALASEGIPAGSDVVAVSVSQYEQMLASLPRELHGECARQIARRLSVAASGSRIYDNDNGHFVWLVQPYTLDALIAQFEGLKALFAAPLIIEGNVLDTNVHFGLDRNADSRPINRIRSAIVSSSEAQAKGKLYEEFGQQRLAQTPWELSLNARIDEALRNGAIWLAFQAQYDLRNKRIGGAETLIRWTDPERGVIPPDSFIIQAERAGRIDALTYWVLERAIEAGRDLSRRAGEMHLSVNLSAWMVDQPGLTRHIAEIVRRTNADSSHLTFEVTETFSMTNREVAKRNLGELRALGFSLSIDDFGTGHASLAYLSEIPSDEIKIDKRFVQAIVASERDRAIVRSTIDLAHALKQQVVAEGVEDGATLQALRDLGCDVAQGYYIGRPIRYEEFLSSILEPVLRKTRAV